MTILNEPQMNRDTNPSQTREGSESQRPDEGCRMSFDSQAKPYVVKSAGGELYDRSPIHPRIGARGYGSQTSSIDRSTAHAATNWAQSGTGNIGYKAMYKIKQQICDVVSHKKNIGVLQTKIQVLMEEVALVQTLLTSGEDNSKDEVQHWFAEADDILKEANDILEGRNNMADKKRLCSSCWDPTSSWDAGKMLRDIERILEQREGLDLSSYIIGLSYCNKLQSRENMLQEMLEALMDIQINMISIYGMIGVGKTILAKELARRAQNDQLFDAIVMVQVSESVDVKLIQSQIANKIGLQLSDDDDEETRAHFLYNALEEKIMKRGQENDTEPVQQSKVLVILDGLQCVIELGKVGIPYGQEGRASCKVVLISRSADVSKKMGAEKQFLVECLNLEEAKVLFQERLGDKIGSMEITIERYQSMENVFLIKCRGLPLVIDTLACTLRSMSWSNWEITVGQMERHTLVEVDELKEAPHAILELCNNFIQNGEKQKLLLLCCLIQQGIHLTTERLKRYGIGFGLFEDPSLAYATQQVNLWVDELKSLSILLASKDSQNIIMHDIIQDVVISALSQDGDTLHVLLDAGTCWHTRESYENCIAISMMPNGNDKCLNGLDLHKLQALLLKDRPSLSLPDNYFQGMQNLRILDIYGTTFVELPSSIGNLKSLVTLHLECCRIKSLSSISNLAKLEVLSLRGSTVEVKLVEIGNLTNLRVLDLTRCDDLFHLGVDVLVRLEQLRELYLRGSSRFWTDIRKLNLLDLEVLEMDISPGRLSPGALCYPHLRRFIICIAHYPILESFEGVNSFSHVLVFNGYGSFKLEESGLTYLLQWTEMLKINEDNGLRNGVGNLSIHGFLQLKKMHIERCSEMECIVDAHKLSMSHREIFLELQILTLKCLPKLQKICCWQPSCTSFPKLRELTLQDLRLLHPHGLPIELATKLRYLKVIDCIGLLFIFPASKINGTDTIVKLPCLEKLELKGLKSLQAIQDPSDASIRVDEPEGPCQVLFNDKIEFPWLKDMCLVDLDQIEKLWDFSTSEVASFLSEESWPKNPYGRNSCFGSLKSMKVSGCGNLECLFSTSIIISLSQLEELEIVRCGRLKEVITSHSEDDASPCKINIIPKLQTLKLEFLESLQCFYRGSILLQFPTLRVFELHRLPKMKTFIDLVNANAQSLKTERTLFIREVIFPSLEHLQVSHMNVELIKGHQDITIFPNLSSLTLNGLPYLKFVSNIKSKKLRVICLEDINCIIVPSSIWPINMPPLLAHNLEELTLSGCNYQQDNLEELVDKHNLIDIELLSSLRNLKLMDLRLLRNIHWNVLRNLRSLIIHHLYVTSLIPTSLLVRGNVLHHLEYMELEKCSSMQVIISDELPVDEDFVIYGVTLFPSLKRIRLGWLSNLQLFGRGSYEALFPSLERVEILECESFQLFSLGTIRTPRLKSLEFDYKTLQTNTFDDLNVILKELVAEQHSRRHLDKAEIEARMREVIEPLGKTVATEEAQVKSKSYTYGVAREEAPNLEKALELSKMLSLLDDYAAIEEAQVKSKSDTKARAFGGAREEAPNPEKAQELSKMQSLMEDYLAIDPLKRATDPSCQLGVGTTNQNRKTDQCSSLESVIPDSKTTNVGKFDDLNAMIQGLRKNKGPKLKQTVHLVTPKAVNASATDFEATVRSLTGVATEEWKAPNTPNVIRLEAEEEAEHQKQHNKQG